MSQLINGKHVTKALRAMGANHRHNVWFNNENREVAQVERIEGMKWQVADSLAIQAGSPLMIDKLLDARFQG
ncbi:serine-threonine kinase [Pectobacterium phage PP74]|uniref:Uncharacterized protein n=1 Tax=Pectobacterium phage PP74 TaxID=1916101 RepID=A0A1J0MEQ1_9CAUD|nr:serine-threonine kinase [Pectobacterium phage PP74]APD19620.1 hypothetical protein PP74_05 [Pectobacterium phage PP74]